MMTAVRRVYRLICVTVPRADTVNNNAWVLIFSAVTFTRTSESDLFSLSERSRSISVSQVDGAKFVGTRTIILTGS